MADIIPPVEVDPVKGDNTPPVVTPPKGDENNDKMNEMIALQMKTFQENLMAQFDGDFKEKLSKLESDKSELEEKKQRLVVMEALRESNLDSSLIDFVYDKDIEISKVKMKQLGDIIAIEVQKGVFDRFKKSSYTPPSDNGGGFSAPGKEKPKYFV